jgi:hypothetical protein
LKPFRTRETTLISIKLYIINLLSYNYFLKIDVICRICKKIFFKLFLKSPRISRKSTFPDILEFSCIVLLTMKRKDSWILKEISLYYMMLNETMSLLYKA